MQPTDCQVLRQTFPKYYIRPNCCDEGKSGFLALKCDERGRVVELTIPGLAGEIPATLTSLSALQHLDMNGNTLNGTIPSWITGFTMLRYLDLSNNRLTGPIPPELANLKNLDYLHLEYNQLNGTIPSSLLTLPKRNFDMNCLTNAPNQNTSCAPPSPFASITLPSVNYDCAIVSNAFTKMGFTRRIPSTGTQCCTWDTSYIRCNEQGFVTALNFEHSQLRGGIDVDLFGLSQLTMLNLNNNYLSQQIPTQLGALTQLQLLDLSFNQLSGGIPDVFSGMDLLARVYLSNNQLTGTIPGSLGALSHLQDIDCGTNYLIGSIPDSLALFINGFNNNCLSKTTLPNQTNCVPSSMLATIGEALGSVAAVGVVVFFVWFYRKEMRKRREFEKRKGSLHQFLLNSSSEW